MVSGLLSKTSRRTRNLTYVYCYPAFNAQPFRQVCSAKGMFLPLRLDTARFKATSQHQFKMI